MKKENILEKTKVQENAKTQTVCNACGKIIAQTGDIYKEALFKADFSWGYFSDKDGRHDRWCLCEKCYDKITASFQIPMETSEKILLMDE